MCSANIAITWSPSFQRSRPVSTNTQVSWSPIALCSSAATTEESTPPDKPEDHLVRADLRAHARDLVLDDVLGGPQRLAAADVDHEAPQQRLPLLACA